MMNKVSSPKDLTCLQIINFPVAHRSRISSVNAKTPVFIVCQAFFLNFRFSTGFLLLEVGEFLNFLLHMNGHCLIGRAQKILRGACGNIGFERLHRYFNGPLP